MCGKATAAALTACAIISALILSTALACNVAPPLPRDVLDAANAAEGNPPDDDAVMMAIEKGKAFLFATQNPDGTWGSGTPGASDTTAIVAEALFRCGVKFSDKRIEPAITWLEKNKPAEASPALRDLLAGELRRYYGGRSLFDRRFPANLRNGGCGKMAADPPPGPPPGEQVWTVLALQAAERAGREVLPEIWKDVAAYWRRRVGPDGKCTRGGISAWALSETATAIMAIRLCAERTDPGPFPPAAGNAARQQDLPSLAFLDGAFADWPANADNAARDVPTNAYLIQQACLATGQWRLGGREVWPTAAAVLLKLQKPDGSWPGTSPLIATAHALDFLAVTRLPLVVAHLQYDGDWNNRPLAMANLTTWVSGNLCNMPMSWRVLDAHSLPAADPAPTVLLITGTTAPKFTPEDLAALRTYVQRGGMIFSCTEGKGDGFAKGIRQAYGQIFPEYEPAPCPEDHPVYRLAGDSSAKRLPLQAITNGPRILAIHCDDDLPLHWQKNDWQTDGRRAFEVAYSAWVGKSRMSWNQAPQRWPAQTKFTPTATVTLLRVRHAGRWDVEPLACERFAREMALRHQVKVNLPPAVTADKLPGRGGVLAFLSGTGPLQLAPAEAAGLKAFLAGGGTLLVEAVGGDEAFASSAKDTLSQFYGPQALKPLPDDSPILPPIANIFSTGEWERRHGYKTQPRLSAIVLDGRAAAFFSPADITAALLGQAYTPSAGYRPELAFDILRNLLLHSAGGQSPR
ncbi:MAG: DUF4159 domain-containing protein [Planctomycetota bacterium]|nr:DUF4159 domain-containing protein [Planctomycetota bacterium]